MVFLFAKDQIEGKEAKKKEEQGRDGMGIEEREEKEREGKGNTRIIMEGEPEAIYVDTQL